MKRLFVQIAAVVLVLSAPSPASAQLVPGGLTGGIKGGITFGDMPEFARVLEDDGAEPGMRMGYLFGGFASMSFDDVFGLQVEGLYIQKGLSYEFDADEFEYRLDYIEIPVLFRMQTARDRGVYALVGPAFGFNVNAKAVSESAPDDVQDSVDISGETAGLEISFVAAVGFQVNRFLVEGRYMEGLTNILDDVDLVTYKTRTFAILAGFRF
jgi:Outer membrane protein beta-barrel domain